MRKNGVEAIAWLASEGASKADVRFLRAAIANGAELSVEVFEGEAGRGQLRRILGSDVEDLPPLYQKELGDGKY